MHQSYFFVLKPVLFSELMLFPHHGELTPLNIKTDIQFFQFFDRKVAIENEGNRNVRVGRF